MQRSLPVDSWNCGYAAARPAPATSVAAASARATTEARLTRTSHRPGSSARSARSRRRAAGPPRLAPPTSVLDDVAAEVQAVTGRTIRRTTGPGAANERTGGYDARMRSYYSGDARVWCPADFVRIVPGSRGGGDARART